MGKVSKITVVFLIPVLLVHLFIFVPRANAVGLQSVIGRIGFRAIAPSVVAAMGAGSGAIIGVALGAGVGYLVLKSGAIDVLKNWWTAYQSQPAPTYPTNGYVQAGGYTWTVDIYQASTGCGMGYRGFASNGQGSYFNNGGNYYYACPVTTASWYNVQTQIFNAIKEVYPSAYWGGPAYYPNVPGDYGTALDANPPAFSDGTIWGSPGLVGAITGGAAIVSVQTGVSDADLDKFIAGSQSTVIDADQASQNTVPVGTDNTLTQDTNALIPLFDRMIGYLSNLIGVRTDIGEVKTKAQEQVARLDNVIANQAVEGMKLDNIAAPLWNIKAEMDNQGIAIANQTAAINTQTGVLDNVRQGVIAQNQTMTEVRDAVNNLDNTISGAPTGSASTIQTRIQALRDIAATKFPFSLATSISVSGISGTNTYEFASLPLTPSISIPINPMAGPLASLFTWFRQLLVWFFWAGTLFAILKKGMEM